MTKRINALTWDIMRQTERFKDHDQHRPYVRWVKDKTGYRAVHDEDAEELWRLRDLAILSYLQELRRQLRALALRKGGVKSGSEVHFTSKMVFTKGQAEYLARLRREARRLDRRSL